MAPPSINELLDQFVDPSADDAQHERAFDAISGMVTFAPTSYGAAAAMDVDPSDNATTKDDDGDAQCNLTLQELVGRMEAHLTSSDDKVRFRATQLLADVLHRAAPGADAGAALPPAAVHLFVVFFGHRLSDYPSVAPSLHALLALVTKHSASFDPK
jgi:hypothetical protein